MRPDTVITELNQMIEDLKRKRRHIDVAIQVLEASRDSINGLPPPLKQLLRDSTAEVDNEAATERPIPSEQQQPQKRPFTQPAFQQVLEESDSGAQMRMIPPEEQGSLRPFGSSQSAFAGKTIAECAVQILSEASGGPLHYIEIANDAALRGYRGRKEGEQTLHQSFWATLNRATDLFEPTGNGHYQLRRQN